MQSIFCYLCMIISVYAARRECTKNSQTRYYLNNKNNIPFYFYYPETASNSIDKCKKISNSELRSHYPWIKSSDEVEHIVDQNNGPSNLIDCNKNIRGNLIISIGIWNNAVGQLCWKDVEAEKRLVYGNKIVDNALEAVSSCCTSSNDTFLITQLSVGLFICFLLILLFIGYYNYCSQLKKTIDNDADAINDSADDELVENDMIDENSQY